MTQNKELKILNNHLKKHSFNKHQQPLTIKEENAIIYASCTSLRDRWNQWYQEKKTVQQKDECPLQSQSQIT
jgi:chromosomal replication initiation ATPase DnaA